jgi:AcrR family transcriptional regulator
MFSESPEVDVPRKKDQGHRRHQIRGAALRVIESRGLLDLRLRDIAEEAGLTPASVLYYYPELEDLLSEAFRHAMERYYERRRELVERVTDARARLVAAVRAGMPSGPDDTEMMLLWEAVPFERTNPALADYDRLYVARQTDLYVSILELGVEQRHFAPTGDLRAIAWNLLALEDYHGLGCSWYLPSVAEAERLVLSYAALATARSLGVRGERRRRRGRRLMAAIGPKPLPQAAPDPRAEEIMVRMRDGTRLATDVYLPPRPGPFPAVLVRLPYGKNERFSFMPQLAPLVTDRGYALVVQDTRGKFRSEGEPVAFLHETAIWRRHARVARGAALVRGLSGCSATYYGFMRPPRRAGRRSARSCRGSRPPGSGTTGCTTRACSPCSPWGNGRRRHGSTGTCTTSARRSPGRSRTSSPPSTADGARRRSTGGSARPARTRRGRRESSASPTSRRRSASPPCTGEGGGTSSSEGSSETSRRRVARARAISTS